MSSLILGRDAAVEILNGECEILLFPNLFSAAESACYLEQLKSEIEWRSESIMMFGKPVLQPRLTAFYGEAQRTYRYSGITMKPNAWTKTLLEIKSRIEPLSAVSFTSALLNLYRSQKDSMGWHRDNEKELGLNPIIGSVSFGATRTFKLRAYADKKRQVSVELESGSFLVMRGETQTLWEHSLPKTSRPKEARINLTFRMIQAF